MLRNRVLTLLGGCLLLGSAALADDLGYVDCTSHPEETQLFAKARKSQDVVATVPCGERFKVVLYGFIFSEVQTADGKVGFVYSSILTIDRGGTLQVRAASPDNTPKLSAASETTKIPADPKPAAAQPKRAPVAPASLPTPAPAPAVADTANAATSASNANSVAAQPAAAQPASPAADVTSAPATAAPATQSDSAVAIGNGSGAAAPPEAPAAPAPASSPAADKAAAVSTGNLPTPPTSPTAAEAAAEAAVSAAAGSPVSAPATDSASTSSSAAPADAPTAAATPAPEAPAPAPVSTAAAEPAAAPASRPQPAEVEPGTPSPKVTTESWEKPNPGGRNNSLVEFFGGFAYSRQNAGGGVSNNFLGGVGAFGFNVKPWLQIAGDSSYNYYDVSGTKYVLYGNHYGPRFFLRQHNPLHRFFGITPFGEAMFGGSREDVHWPAAGGYSAYTTSTNVFSWKAGGGIDMRASRLFEIRLIDVDYYRTSFGGTNQSNYWVSTGIVLRLFRGSSD